MSPSPEALNNNKDNAMQGLSEQEKQHQADFSRLLTPQSQSRELPNWKLNTDFLDLSGGPGVTDDVVVQNLLNCSTSLSDTGSLTTPLDPSYMDSQISALANDGTTDSDHSVPAAPYSSPNLAGLNGYSAIHLAAHFGKFSIIRLLLSACPQDVDLLNHEGQTPLHIAALEGHAEMIPELLRSGANALMQDAEGRTALHLAVAKEHFDVVRLLLDDDHSQAMIRIADGAGKTSLHQAVLQECGEIVRLLLERGADPRTPLWSGKDM